VGDLTMNADDMMKEYNTWKNKWKKMQHSRE
jgi:hypothetical protein